MQEDQFEKFVRENKKAFDNDIPSDKAWPNIKKKRLAESKQKTIVLWPLMRKIAATLIIGLAGIGIYNLLNDQGALSLTNQSYIPPDVVEMDQFYEQQVNAALTELQSIEGVDSDLSSEVSLELNFLHEEKIRLLEELKNDVDNEQIVEELIRTYRLRLEVLEDVLAILKEINGIENEYEYNNEISL